MAIGLSFWLSVIALVVAVFLGSRFLLQFLVYHLYYPFVYVSGPTPNFRTNYAIAVKPVGYPETALICGREDSTHEEIGWVYLLSEEHEEYQSGKRVFGLWGPDSSSSAAKARVSDEVVEGLNKWNQEDEVSTSGLQSQSSIDRY